MPKVLTMTPKEGESTEEFADRVAAQVDAFFTEAPPAEGEGEEGALGWKPGDDKAEAEGTDEPAEPETPPKQEQPDT